MNQTQLYSTESRKCHTPNPVYSSLGFLMTFAWTDSCKQASFRYTAVDVESNNSTQHTWPISAATYSGNVLIGYTALEQNDFKSTRWPGDPFVSINHFPLRYATSYHAMLHTDNASLLLPGHVIQHVDRFLSRRILSIKHDHLNNHAKDYRNL